MSREYFMVEKGLHIVGENSYAGVKYLFAAGAPSLDSEVGSVYSDSTSGYLYHKKTAGSGADKWIRVANYNDITGIKWRSEKVVALTSTAAPLELGTIDIVAAPLGGDEAPLLVAADFLVGEYILFGQGGTEKLGKISDITGDVLTFTYVDVPVLAAGDTFMVINYLPDSPNAQEKQAIVLFNGTDYIKISDVNWDIATGINLSSGYTPGSGNPVPSESVEAAIQKIDGNVDALNTLSGMGQGAVDLDTFTGTIIADDSTIKAALQALETFTEAIQVSKSQAAITTEVVLDSVLVDNIHAVEWYVKLYLDSAPEQVFAEKIHAIHNGTAAADATAVDANVFGKVKLGAAFDNVIDVVLSGTAGAQVMKLTVSAAAAVTAKSIRRNIVF